MFDPKNFPADALRFADVIAGLSEGDTIGGHEGREEECERHCWEQFEQEASQTRDSIASHPFAKIAKGWGTQRSLRMTTRLHEPFVPRPQADSR